jgi:quinoprotein glucose dehydrogenase
MLMDVLHDGRRVPAVVQATKMGHVFVLHRESGEPLFPVEERRVPQTDVPGETTAATQVFPVQPPPLHSNDVKLWESSDESVEFCRALLEGVRQDGIFTPPSLGGTLLFPGNGGGTNWGSMAADPERQIAVLALNRFPTVVTLIPRKEFRQRQKNADKDVVDKEYTEQEGTPYGMSRFELYNPKTGLPCLEGPWGEVVALDMQKGDVLWRKPLGVFPGFEDHPQASQWGSVSAGGPMITSTGLIFIAPRFGHELLAYRSQDGSIAWRGKLPAMATATPMSYIIDNEQYIVIAAGGDFLGGEAPGDYLLAFKLATGTASVNAGRHDATVNDQVVAGNPARRH